MKTQKPQCYADNCEIPSLTRGLCKKHYTRMRRGKDINAKTTYEMTLKERLMSKVEKTDSCWNWIGRTAPPGWYGVFTLNGKGVNCHRVSYEVHCGSIPEGMSVLHSCDNPACVNPDHLFLGTQKDNMRDMYNKGRQGSYDKRGSSNPRAKLDASDIHVIRDLLEVSTKKTAIAWLFDVSPGMIGHIEKGRLWTHV